MLRFPCAGSRWTTILSLEGRNSHLILVNFFLSKSNNIDIDKRENFGIADVVYGFDGGSLNPVENTSVAKFVKLVML